MQCYVTVAQPQGTCVGEDPSCFVCCAALSQPVTSQTTVSVGFWQNGRSCGALQFRNGKTNWLLSKPRNLEFTQSECMFWFRRLLQQWEVAGKISVSLWVKVHLHRQTAVAWALLLVCVKCSDRPQQHWCHDACGVAFVSFMSALARKCGCCGFRSWRWSRRTGSQR